jgi:hypothetical protein
MLVPLYIQILFYKNETKRYFSRNETRRNDIFFGTETENRNEIYIFQKRKGTKRKKKKHFVTPGFNWTHY